MALVIRLLSSWKDIILKGFSNLNGSLSNLIAIKVFMFYSGAIWLEVN